MKAFRYLFCIICLMMMESNTQQLNYRMVDWAKANDLISKKGVLLLKSIEFNNAQVYKNKETFIIMPLNPFTKAILTKDSLLLESWIDKQIFPMDEGINRFYFDNRTKIDHLNSAVPILVKELLDAVGIEATIVTAVEIDKIYAFLVDEKNFERYKLNYIALIGDFLKSRGTAHIHWGLLKRKQFLNPLMQIVLVKKEGDTIHYFNLEEKLDSWELSDRKSLEYDLEHMHWSRSNEIETAEAIE